MKSFNGDPGYLHDCDACGGQFVDHLLLRDLLERRTLYGRQVPPHLLRANPLLRPVRYFKCPACKKSLLRQNFGGKSGIIVNTCTQHGTWFHPGELPRVLAFVEAGGLREAKRAELGLPNNLNDAERRALGEALQKARERDSPLLEMNVMTGVGEVAQDVFDSCKGMLESVGTWLNRKK